MFIKNNLPLQKNARDTIMIFPFFFQYFTHIVSSSYCAFSVAQYVLNIVLEKNTTQNKKNAQNNHYV